VQKLLCLATAAVLRLSAADACAAPPLPLRLSGRVTRCLDGDTYDVLTARGPLRVRIRNADCPELTQPFGKQAADSVARLLQGRLVYLAPVGTDLYGRTLAPLWLPAAGGRLLSVDSVLVARGWAWAVGASGREFTGTWVAQQTAATSARRGQWKCASASAAVVPPRVWRGLSAANKRRYWGTCRW
jgi:micrococcal nuclease